jgi:hypothetical protein
MRLAFPRVRDAFVPFAFTAKDVIECSKNPTRGFDHSNQAS